MKTNRFLIIPRRAILLLAAAFLLFMPAFAGGVCAAPAAAEPVGTWQLVSSDQSDTWQGDNFHGLRSEYTSFNNGDTMGATYTQYNIIFDDKQPQTINSVLNGTCSWYWDGGSIPAEVTPGTGYAFTTSAEANATGTGYFWTVNAYAQSSETGGTIAFAQAFLDTSQGSSASQQGGGTLTFSAGQKDGETRTLTLLCQVDIVTVQSTYNYVWQKGGCAATLSLPDGMKPNQNFSPNVSVVDADGKGVQPASAHWYYNGSPSGDTMKWDGKAATVTYEYTCPGQTNARTTSINIPAAPACSASIVLPNGMEPNKEFTPRLEVVDLQGNSVQAQNPTWYYNGAPAGGAMKWDGKQASLKVDYTCPVDQSSGSASATIPAAETGGWLVVVGGLGTVISAALAVAGITLVRKGGKGEKDKPRPRFILQVDKSLLEVKPKESTPLNIQAWRINPDGSTAPASEAVLEVSVPQTAAGLAATPTSGVSGMRCLFSVPRPTVCENLTVTINASAGLIKTSATVVVKIVPLYDLKLAWHDPTKTQLKPGEPEIFAYASLSATPLPDAQTTPDQLAEKIKVTVEGPNNNLVELKTSPPGSHAPYAREGFLWIPVRALAAPEAGAPAGNPQLMARFPEDKPPLEKSLPLNLAQTLVLGAWVQGKQQVDVVFDKNISAWGFSEIIAYFHEPGKSQEPASPTFKYELTAESVKFDPPVLQVTDVYPHARDQYTIRVELDPAAELEQHFGPDLCRRGGIINVKVSVKPASGQPLTADVSYCLRPQLELFAHPAAIRGRTYKGIQLAPNELVADSDDRYEVVIGCCRTDQPEPRDADQIEQVNPAWWDFKGSLLGSLGGSFKAERPEAVEGGERTLLLQSTKPLLAQPGQADEGLTLKLEGCATAELPPQYLRTSLSLDLKLQPRLPNLRLWVVPGRQRGTSEAWLLAFLGSDPSQALADTVIQVSTEALESGGPQLATPSQQNQTSIITPADGSEQVQLFYSGLNWTNYQQAIFKVAAHLQNKSGELSSEPVQCVVNVKENVDQLLANLLARAALLKLNNPYFENRSLGVTSLIDLTEYRPFVRGPVWNACEQFSGNESAYGRGDKRAKFAHDYVCSEFRDRIANWLVRQRHYQPGRPESVDEIAHMNGIEFDNFIVASGLHNYEALFLAGMQPTDDPRGLDPWWKQSWKDEAYGNPDGLISSNWERYYSVETAAWLTVALTPAAVGTFLYTGGVGTALFIESLGPIIAAYAAGTAGELSEDRMYENGEYAYRGAHKFGKREVFIQEWKAANPNV